VLLAPLGVAVCTSSTTGGAGGSIGNGGTGGTGGSGGSGGGGSGGTPSCGTCAEVFTQGGIVCGNTDGADAWQALATCACAGACADACSASFCMTAPTDPTCSTCLGTSCPSETTDCSMN
jgi:hypothetical protein